ncbi:MAG: hypothetical protein JO203_01200 [Gammaproteobacteria bacterium]|nr:hypothetical protein [Gammaproteobacteria bacterium]
MHMRGASRARRALAMIVWLTAALPAWTLEPLPARLDYQVDEGLNINRLLREGGVAAHLVLRSGTDPRILIAFPAGDSGVAVWFAHRADKVHWALAGALRAVHRLDRRGRALNGLVADATVVAPELQIREVLLSSVRVLRDYQALGAAPAAVATKPLLHGRTLSWSRERLDGAAGYRLTLEVTHGELQGERIRAGADGRIGLRITGLTGETPLVPLAGGDLLNELAATDSAARDTLAFLAYREKLLAGSWRFQTYFGRDTLISTRLLMPVLGERAIEAALGSVLARLSPLGEVAHEEDIGERAVLDHLEHDGTRSAVPVLDYKMIDGNYLLAPVVSAWLLEDERGRRRAAAFLAAAGGEATVQRARGATLVSNLRLVVQSARAFAARSDATGLVALKGGYAVGDWRDSESGLGGGRYPYDVNAVLVPAALTAIAQLQASGLLGPYLTSEDEALLAGAAQLAQLWREKVPELFAVRLSHQAAVAAIRAYAGAQGVAPEPALDALGTGELRFAALALDAAGRPIPVMHSDEGFALLFDDLPATRVDEAVRALLRPFPAGLMTGVGMLVANPAFCAAPLQESFSRNAYHGTVVWSWQQALFAAGLARQLGRPDLPGAVRADLVSAQRVLWSAIDATRSMSNSELWSWSYADGRFAVAPFGSAAADVDESDAAQLWSTAYLAVRPAVVVGSVLGTRVAARTPGGMQLAAGEAPPQ